MDDEQLHDYTELVIELTASIVGLSLSLTDVAGGGDSRDGIDRIREAAMAMIDAESGMPRERFWDGWWIDAVQEYAHQVSCSWCKNRDEPNAETNYRELAEKVLDEYTEEI